VENRKGLVNNICLYLDPFWTENNGLNQIPNNVDKKDDIFPSENVSDISTIYEAANVSTVANPSARHVVSSKNRRSPFGLNYMSEIGILKELLCYSGSDVYFSNIS